MVWVNNWLLNFDLLQFLYVYLKTVLGTSNFHPLSEFSIITNHCNNIFIYFYSDMKYVTQLHVLYLNNRIERISYVTIRNWYVQYMFYIEYILIMEERGREREREKERNINRERERMRGTVYSMYSLHQ